MLKNNDSNNAHNNQGIKIYPHKVVKWDLPDLMQIEVEKTKRAHQIGETTGLFKVPEILDYNSTKGIVTLEKIQNIQSIASYIPQNKIHANIVERIGKSLAMIHTRLELPDSMIIPLPECCMNPGDPVFIHGDFNGLNVCFDPIKDSIVILDWQSSSVLEHHSSYGSRYFDVTVFLLYLFIWASKPFHINKSIKSIAQLFLRKYFGSLDLFCQNQEFIKYMKNFCNNWVINKISRLSFHRFLYIMPNYLQMRILLSSSQFNILRS